jgi:hypothetical protein
VVRIKKSRAGRTQPGTWKKVSVSLMAKGIAWAGMSQTQATGGCVEYFRVELLRRGSLGSGGGWFGSFIIVSYDRICLYLQNKLQGRAPRLGMD